MMRRMIVGMLELQVRLEGCFSLKDNRRVLQSLVVRSRQSYGVSIAEVGDQDLWNVATIGVSQVSNELRHSESVLQKVVDLFDASSQLEIESAVKEFTTFPI